MRVAVAQLRARDLADRSKALEEVEEAILRGGKAGADLVVLPECAWPSYVIGTDLGDRWTGPEEQAALGCVARATREAGLVSVVGLAMNGNEGLRNVAVVHEPTGRLVGTVGKRFLWDVDTRWFVASEASEPIDTSVGRLGILICADGRMPEIARSLALQGAQILLDPTAWVTTGSNPATWTNPQFEFMLPARAWENRLPAVAANKVGFEEGVLAYCGRSVVLDADGDRVAVARSDGPDLIMADVELADPNSRVRGALDGHDHASLTSPTESLVAHRRRLEDLPLIRARPRLVVMAGSSPHPSSRTARVLGDLGATLTITDDAPSPGPVVELAGFGVAALATDDLDGPEAARVAMLAGADLVVWRGPRERLPEVVFRSRAAENRVYLVVLDPRPDDVPWALVIDPEGRVRARITEDRPILICDLQLADARTKEMAPGTDVVAGRQPNSYGSLIGRGHERNTP